jgi:MFS family permease
MGFKQLHLGKHVCIFLTMTRSILIIMVVFHNPHSAILGLISSMYALGAILAVPFVPYIADTFGRKRSVQLGSTLMIIGATIQAASQNLAMFMASRIIIGFGISFAIVAASTLIGGKFNQPVADDVVQHLASAQLIANGG